MIDALINRLSRTGGHKGPGLPSHPMVGRVLTVATDFMHPRPAHAVMIAMRPVGRRHGISEEVVAHVVDTLGAGGEQRVKTLFEVEIGHHMTDPIGQLNIQ